MGRGKTHLAIRRSAVYDDSIITAPGGSLSAPDDTADSTAASSTASAGVSGAPDPRVLGWLLAAHNLLQALPSDRQLGEFVARAMRDVPGVLTGGACLRTSPGPMMIAETVCRTCCTALEEGYAEMTSDCCSLTQAKAVILPLEASQGHYGQLVLHVKDRAAFSPYRPFVSNFAGSLGLILENRWHRRHLEEAYRRERDLALHLQKAFLPPIPEVPGVEIDVVYQSATDLALVGGDFYDLVPLPDGRVAVLVGDVCGKGIAAAARMETVRSTIHAFAALGLPPGEWLALANRSLTSAESGLDFATAALVVLDPRSGTFEYSLAGHPPPLVADPAKVEAVPLAGGVPLGVMNDGAYGCASATLGRGATLILYTDGVFEAKAKGQFFGIEVLEEEARDLAQRPLSGAAAALVASARDYSGGELADDAVVALVRLRPPSA